MNILPITTSYITRTIKTSQGVVLATFAIHRCGANYRFEIINAIPLETNDQNGRTTVYTSTPFAYLPGKMLVVSHFAIASPFVTTIPNRSFSFLSVQKTRAPSLA